MFLPLLKTHLQLCSVPFRRFVFYFVKTFIQCLTSGNNPNRIESVEQVITGGQNCILTNSPTTIFINWIENFFKIFVISFCCGSAKVRLPSWHIYPRTLFKTSYRRQQNPPWISNEFSTRSGRRGSSKNSRCRCTSPIRQGNQQLVISPTTPSSNPSAPIPGIYTVALPFPRAPHSLLFFLSFIVTISHAPGKQPSFEHHRPPLPPLSCVCYANSGGWRPGFGGGGPNPISARPR